MQMLVFENFVIKSHAGSRQKRECSRETCKGYNFLNKNWYKAQRKAKFYINKCRSASCMQGGLKQASA